MNRRSAERDRLPRAALFGLAALLLASMPGRAAAAAVATTDAPPELAIENVSVIDVTRGEAIGPKTVWIAAGRIIALADPAALTAPPGVARVDGSGRFLLPGLVDLHVHLFNNATRRPPNTWAFPLFVANGVTSVREMATANADQPLVAGWRKSIERGELIAPRIIATGSVIRALAGAADLPQEIAEARRVGASFLKVFSGLPESAWRAALEAARPLGLPVGGHIPGEVDALSAARAGQRSNEHLTQLYEASSAREEEWLAARRGRTGPEIQRLLQEQEREVLETFDPARCAALATALARTDQVQVPTLVLPHFEARGARQEFRADPRWRLLRADEQTRWERILAAFPGEDARLASRRWEVSRNIVRALHSAGVKVLAGTDAPMPLVYPGFALHQELELLVEAGLSPAEALRAATLGPAEFLGLAATSGSIAPGKQADLVLLEANPLEQIRNTRRILGVVLNGRWLPRPQLDALLAPAAGLAPSPGAAPASRE